MRSLLHTFDTAIADFVTSWPSLLDGFFISMTWLGWPVVTASIGLLIVAVGIANRNVRLVLSGACVWGALGIGLIIKHIIGRDRPLEEYAASAQVDGLSMSFPSGHTIGAVIAYGLLAYLLARSLPQPWSYIVACILTLLLIFVSLSRIYLSAHFPSDVAGGILIGGTVLLIVILVIKPRLYHKKQDR